MNQNDSSNTTTHQQSTHSDIYNQLFKIYSSEYIDECTDILNHPESDFLHRFLTKMTLIIQRDFGDDIIEDIAFAKEIKSIERRVYESFYQPMKSSCLIALNNFTKPSNKRRNDSSFLQNFRSHCSFNLVPLHTCKGRFIPVYDSKGKVVYVICVNCKSCFYDSSIIMYCNNCKCSFYSSVISSVDKQLPPATWDKYHCNALMNEQMKCIKCQDLFFLRNGSLICKSCKFITNPLDVVWKCVVCKKEFKSYAKIYNPLEFKMVKIAIRNALLYKAMVKPMELKCGCEGTNALMLNYKHKAQCKGVLYHGVLDGKDIIICSICRVMASYNKFKWECPICLKTFTTRNFKVIENEESNSLLMLEISKQIKGDGEVKTMRVLSQPLPSDGNINEGIICNKAEGLKLQHRNSNKNNDANNMLTPSKENNTKDNPRQRNLSINLRERSGSKKKDNLTASIASSNNDKHTSSSNINHYEDDDNDDNPYYSNNKIHVYKMKERNLHNNNSQSNSNKHHSYQKRCMTFNDDPQEGNSQPNSYTTTDLNDPRSNHNQKNYKHYVPQSIINLGSENIVRPFNSISNLKANSTDVGDIERQMFSSTGNNFQRFNILSYNIDSPMTVNKFSIGEKRSSNPFKLVNRENETLKEEVMGYNRRTHDKRKTDNVPINSMNDNSSNQITSTPSASNAYPNQNVSGNSIGSNINHLQKSPLIAQDRLGTERNIAVNLEQYLKSPYIDNKINSNPVSPFINNIVCKTPKVDIEPSQPNDDFGHTEGLLGTNLCLMNIDDYAIVTQLGQGTFGKIYLVKDKKNNKNIYSLKKIILTEELDLESILKEYQLVNTLQHPNIIKILGYNQAKLDFATYVIYIFMEVGFTDWEKEIRTHIDQRQYYTEKEIWNILKQLASALAFLQKENVSHRDIKPGNVLVFKNSVYKIADFGEAKQVTKNQQTKQANTLRGTELYMSPLLFNGIKTNQLDIKHNLYKSDVFSLGLCIAFAMSLTTNTIMEIRKMVDAKNVKNYLRVFFKERYSLKLMEMVGDMLEINERMRVDFVDLEKKLENC